LGYARGSQEGLPEELDRRDVQQQYDIVIQFLDNNILTRHKK